MKLRNSAVALGLATALLMSGCSSSDNGSDDPTTGGGSTGGNAAQGASLTIAKPDGALATEVNSPWIGDGSALKLGYANAIYEPLAFVNPIDASADLKLWLASDVEWAEDYTSVTVTARDGVKWNDGTDFTAADIAFTYNLLKDTPAIETNALGLKDVVLDGNKVTISFESSVFVKQDKVLQRYIVPEHIWKDVADVTTDPNLNPVGTGPYTLANWTSQSVQLDARDDYWGGELAVPTLFYVSYNDNTSLTTALANGDADWAQAFIPNVESAYISKDPDHNIYWAPAGLGVDALFVNTTKKPFDDVAFRTALNMVIDRDQYREIAREGGVPPLTSVTGLPTPAGDAFISDEYKGVDYTVDVEGARKVLTDAGYTWDGDALVDPDGTPVTFTLSVPQGWSDYVTGISLIQASAQSLGATASTDTPDADTWWANKGTGEFDAILHWTDTGATAWDIYSNTMDGTRLEPIGTEANFNFGRFDSPEATAALHTYANSTDPAERAEAIATAQKIFVEQAPAMPVGTRPFIGQFNTRNYVGWPSDEAPYTQPDPTQASAVLILTSLKPAS